MGANVQKRRRHLRFGSLAAVHAAHDDVGLVGLSDHPEGLFGRFLFFDFLLDELGASGLSVLPDLGLVLLLDVVRLVLEWQVNLGWIRDGAYVKDVLLGAEKTLHGDGEGEFGGLATVDGDQVAVAALLGRYDRSSLHHLFHVPLL